jgi:hypothetical protein
MPRVGNIRAVGDELPERSQMNAAADNVLLLQCSEYCIRLLALSDQARGAHIVILSARNNETNQQLSPTSTTNMGD